MKNVLRLSCLSALLGMSLISQAAAQLSFTTRESKLQYQYLYGFADQTTGGAGSGTVSNPHMSHGAGMKGDDSGNDFYKPSGTEWSAAVAWNFGHGYRINGERNNFQSMSASGSSTTTASSRSASADVNILQNELVLEFYCADPVTMVMQYEVMITGFYPQNRAEIWLEVADPSGAFQYFRGWAQVGQTVVDSFQIQPGLYRLRSFAFSQANAANQNAGFPRSSYRYALAVNSNPIPPYITWNPDVGPIQVKNPVKIGNTFTADVISDVNVDIYRSFDLQGFGSSPIATNVAPGTAVLLDGAASSTKAFYVLGPAGGPAPWTLSPPN